MYAEAMVPIKLVFDHEGAGGLITNIIHDLSEGKTPEEALGSGLYQSSVAEYAAIRQDKKTPGSQKAGFDEWIKLAFGTAENRIILLKRLCRDYKGSDEALYEIFCTIHFLRRFELSVSKMIEAEGFRDVIKLYADSKLAKLGTLLDGFLSQYGRRFELQYSHKMKYKTNSGKVLVRNWWENKTSYEEILSALHEFAKSAPVISSILEKDISGFCGICKGAVVEEALIEKQLVNTRIKINGSNSHVWKSVPAGRIHPMGIDFMSFQTCSLCCSDWGDLFLLWSFIQGGENSEYRICTVCGRPFLPDPKSRKTYCNRHTREQRDYYKRMTGKESEL